MSHIIISFSIAALLATSPALAQTPPPASSPSLALVTAQTASSAATHAFDGVVEAVRQAVVSAQVSGAVVQVEVEAGERVKAGQVLLRIDASTAEQNAAAANAQAQAATSSLELAAKDLERQRQLFQQNYISQAALDRTEAAYKAARAQANASLAQSRASRAQSGLHVLRAPFAGVVAQVPVSPGDMAMPGRALVTLYDPHALRIRAAIPQSAAANMQADKKLRIELPALPETAEVWVDAKDVQFLPMVDASTHTVVLRAALPADTNEAVTPGMFARVYLPLARADDDQVAVGNVSVLVPKRALVRRAELTALYVLNAQGKAVLRQVRVGQPSADGHSVEILSGLMPGEQVVLHPQSAARGN